MLELNHARNVSIHAPRAGSDVRINREWMVGLPFQSTPPVRGATRARCDSKP